MAILSGIEATLFILGRPVTREYHDRGQNPVLYSFVEQEAHNKVSNFISVEKENRADRFDILCTIQPGSAFHCEYLAFDISINGTPNSLKFFRISDLIGGMMPESALVSPDGVYSNQLSFDAKENFVDLRVFEMKRPKLMRSGSPTSDKPLTEGNLLGSNARGSTRGRGKFKYLHGQDWYQMEIANELPIAQFTWKHAELDTLQKLLIAPRSPKPPFEILAGGNPHAVLNIEDPPDFPWAGLVEGKTMLDVDHLAFRSLSYSSLKRASHVRKLGMAEIERLASKYVDGMNCSHLPLHTVFENAMLYVQSEVLARIHMETLRELAKPKFRESTNERRNMNEATLDRELGKLSGEELESIAGEQKAAELAVGRMSIERVQHYAKKQLPRGDFRTLSSFEAKKYASKRLMEKNYIEAQLKVVVKIAGEKLLADQRNNEQMIANDPEAQQQRDAAEPSAAIRPPGDAGGPADDAQPQIKQEPQTRARAAEQAPTASGSGEASNLENSRRRTRSQANDAASDRPEKRSRAA